MLAQINEPLTFEVTKEMYETLRSFSKDIGGLTLIGDLAHKLDLDEPKVIAILLALSGLGICSISLLVYHGCQSEYVLKTPFGNGFPVFPLLCPSCGDILGNEDVSYRIAAGWLSGLADLPF